MGTLIALFGIALFGQVNAHGMAWQVNAHAEELLYEEQQRCRQLEEALEKERER